MLRNTLLAVVLALGAITAGTAAGQNKANEDDDGLLVLLTMDNPVTKACLDSGFRRHTGLIALSVAKTSDHQIHEAMTKGVTSPEVLAQMNDEFNLWVSSRKTDVVAHRAFENCMALQKSPVAMRGTGTTCFNIDLIPSFVRAARGQRKG